MNRNIAEAKSNLTEKQSVIIYIILTKLEDDNNVRYTLDFKEFEQALNIMTSYKDFKETMESFKDKGFTIINKKYPEGVWFRWFSKIEYKDDENEIDVNIDVDLKDMLYQIK